MTILVFDIETIPDIETGRKLYELEGLSDKDTAAALFALRRAKTGNDFLPHHLQKIVAISMVMSNANQFKVWSLGDENSSEKELIQRFFSGISKYTPTLVSWNGSGRLPSTAANPEPYRRSETFPSFWRVNGQITKRFGDVDLYVGTENLFDFIQQDPVIAADAPNGPFFDGSLSWGPLDSRIVYVGIRYTLE